MSDEKTTDEAKPKADEHNGEAVEWWRWVRVAWFAPILWWATHGVPVRVGIEDFIERMIGC